MTNANPRATIGGNNPPPESALETWQLCAADLLERSTGIVVKDDAQYDETAALIKEAKQALAGIKKAVTKERAPHKAAADAISDMYKPTEEEIGAVVTAAVNANADYRKEQERKKAEELAEARRVEREAQERAAALAAKADRTEAVDLAELSKTEDEARRASIAAKKVNSRKVASGGVRMRTEYTASITDARALWSHIAKVDPDAITSLLTPWVEARKKDGDIPGVQIETRKVPV